MPDLTVAQNMRLARVPRDAVLAAMRRLGVEHIDLLTPAREIDVAVLRLIDLARALASNPSLLLDEITAGLPADLSERVFANRLQALLPQRSIRENVALAARGGFNGGGPIDMGAEKARVEHAVRRLQIDTRAFAELKRLSGGNQQKVVIARWLAAGFRTLLCFDPTRGIDIGTKKQIYALLREVASQGLSVLLFTSELPEIRLACDRAIVLFGGRISGEMEAQDTDEARPLHAAHRLTPSDEEALA